MNSRFVSFTAAAAILALVCVTGSNGNFISPYVGFGFNPLVSGMYGYGLGNFGYGGFGKSYGYGGFGGMGGLGMGGLGMMGKFPFMGMGYPMMYPFYGGMGGLGMMGGMYGGGYGMGGYGMGGFGKGGLGLGLLKKEAELDGDYYKRMAQDEASILSKKYGSSSGKYVPGTLGTVNA